MRGPRPAGASVWVVPALALATVLPEGGSGFEARTDLPERAAKSWFRRQWNHYE